MFRTYTTAQTRAAEERSVARGVSLKRLMDNAGRALAKAAMELCPDLPIAVVCGMGNNGGDGYVCAAALRSAGKDVTVWGINRETLADESLAGAAALSFEQMGGVIYPLTDDIDKIALPALIVDAVFGIGLTRPVSGVYARAISLINQSGVKVLSCDVPSGIDADTGRVLGDAARANVTLMLGLAKPACYLKPGCDYFGDARLADIGIPENVIAGL